MKSKRQDRIVHLIAEHIIETQDELIAKLMEEGYSVTQATISRDIRELKISKIMGEGGKYHYVLPATNLWFPAPGNRGCRVWATIQSESK